MFIAINHTVNNAAVNNITVTNTIGLLTQFGVITTYSGDTNPGGIHYNSTSSKFSANAPFTTYHLVTTNS